MATRVEKSKTMRKRRLRRGLTEDLLVYGANVVMAVLFFIPLAWAVCVSLLPEQYLFTFPPTLFHWPPEINNYVRIWQVNEGRLAGYVRTSALVACLTVLSVTSVSGLAGYAFARLRFAGKNVLFLLILSAMMFPFTAVLIPLFPIMSRLRLVNNPLVLVILYTVFQLPFSTYLFRNFFEMVPAAIYDAALIDGCSKLSVFRRVMLPLSGPAIATVAIYSFYNSWNEFTAALIFLTSDKATTLPVGLASMAQSQRFSTAWDILMTGSVLSFIPVLIIFLLFQRYFVRGLMSGATKG